MKKLVAIIALLFMSIMFVGCSHDQAIKTKRSHAVIATHAVGTAMNMVGTRYTYGGKTPKKGFDCSGLVYYSYRQAGLAVPRTTKQQLRASKAISRNRLAKGDLIFFNQLGRRAGHVGIYIGNGQFVHAPSSGKHVRVDNLKTRYWKKHLASMRRFNY